MKKKFLAMLAIILTLSVSLTACGQKGEDTKTEEKSASSYQEDYKVEKVELKPEDYDENSTMYKILTDKKLIVGTNATYPPYEFRANIDGESKIVGIDADLAFLLGQKLGIEVDVQDVDFDALITGLTLGNYDLLLAGMNNDPERAKSVSFSDDYYNANMVVLMNKDDVEKYQTPEDFNEEFIFGNQLGTIHEKLSQEKFPKAQSKSIQSYSDLIVDLKAGNVNGMLIEDVVAKSYVAENPDLAINDAVSFKSDTGMAMVLKKDDTQFQEFLNQFIKEITDNGTLEKIIVNNNNLADSSNSENK